MSVRRVLRVGVALLGVMSSEAWSQSAIQQQEPAASPVEPAVVQDPAAGVISQGNPLADRPQMAPVLRFLMSQGVKLTTLGTEGGLAGYLGESPNSRMQVFYVTPDGSHVIAGLMFDSQGANMTGVQLGEMQRRFESAQKQLQPETGAVGSTPTPAPAPAPVAAVAPAAPAAAVPVTPAPNPVQAAPAQSKMPAAPVPGQQSSIPGIAKQAAAEVPSSLAPVANPSGSDKYLSLLDRGGVERALQEVPWFTVGVKEAPAVYMVVDPQCPFCHAAWQRLQGYVFAKKIQLRLVMIAGLRGSPPLAISILSRDNPGQAWLKGEGSVDNFTIDPPPTPDTQPYQIAARYLDLNADFVRKFGISKTPTFLYFGKDERLYSSVGLPDDADVFLAAAMK